MSIRKTPYQSGMACLTAVLLLVGCADNPVRQANTQLPGGTSTATPTPPPAPPPDITDALLPPMPEQQPEQPRLDVDAQQVPAVDFFTSLVRGSQVNMVVHPEVSGNISLSLRRVALEEVMQIVHRVYGYEYEKTSSGYLVLPARLQARTFHVNYLNLQREGESQTRVSAGELAQGDDSGPQTNGGSNDQESRPQAFGTRVQTRTVSDFWSELDASLSAIVGEAEGRAVVLSPQASLVVVRAMPSELREVEQYLSDVQASMNRQVILEARILEVRLDEGFQSGINWAQLLESDGDVSVIGQRSSGLFQDEAGRFSANDLLGDDGQSFSPFDPVGGLDNSAFGGVFSAAVRLGDFAAFIELLERQGDVHVLSSPRIATINNQKAVIKVGSDEFFVTDISTTTVASTATTTTPNVQLTPFFSGIALDVTPQISLDNEVILHIHPSVSEVTDQRKEISVGGQDQSLPLAFSTVRESDSIIRAANGQVVVIGGLMQEQIQYDQAGVPVLGRMPLVGPLFRQTRERLVKTELVILLKPIVVESARTWQQQIDEHQQRLQTLGSHDADQ
jgi:MSHA biogenesis protein MshL